jgi:hypothetical protein
MTLTFLRHRVAERQQLARPRRLSISRCVGDGTPLEIWFGVVVAGSYGGGCMRDLDLSEACVIAATPARFGIPGNNVVVQLL